MENPFKKSSEIKDDTTKKKEEEKNTSHDFKVMPDGTISEDITPEEYQEIQKDK